MHEAIQVCTAVIGPVIGSVRCNIAAVPHAAEPLRIEVYGAPADYEPSPCAAMTILARLSATEALNAV